MNTIHSKLTKLVNRVRKEWLIHVVFLTGSYAKEKQTAFSDIDVVILGEFPESFLDRSLRVMELIPELPELDPLCYTPEEFQRMFLDGSITVLDCLNEGKVIFGEDFLKPYHKAFTRALQEGLTRTSVSWILPASFRL